MPEVLTMKQLLICTLILFFTPGTAIVEAKESMKADDTTPVLPFRNESLPVSERVADLLSRLTLQEKIAQMYDKAPAIERLNIPRYEWWNEALHGVARAGEATVFPQAIGLAASFDEELVLGVSRAIATEARAKHHDFVGRGTRSMYTGLTFWSPNINIFRDPRWGRGQETYGEDPLLTAKIATSFVRGLEGDDPDNLKTVATLKHYAVHSGPEPSRHSDNFDPSPYDLRATYLPAFERVIRATNVHSIMCAYNAVNGEPACANNYLMKDVLRDEFGFEGYVVSDCGAIADIYKKEAHHFVATKKQAAALAVKSGTDIECGDGDGSVYRDLEKAVAEGLISEQEIDQSLSRLLTARFKLGMFDTGGGPHANVGIEEVGSVKHLDLALQAAKKAFVLLDNDGILPLKPGAKIALIGPNADNADVLTANYHGTPVQPATPRKALANRLGDKLDYAVGAALAPGVYTHYAPVPAAVFSHGPKDHTEPGLRAEYFNNPEFSGRPIKSEIAAIIDFHWRLSPLNNLDDDEFSVRFSGWLTPPEDGNYLFSGGLSIEIDGEPVEGAIQMQQGRSYAFSAAKAIRQAWHSNAIQPSVVLSWLNTDRRLLAEAVEIAKQADVIVFAGGLSARLEGEEMPLEIDGFAGGDRTSLELPQSQQALLKALKATGKPLVYANFSGSAVNLAWTKQNANAVIQGFYPGEATGRAFAQLLYGEFNPAGRLPVTFYQSVDDLPPFSSYDMAERTYKYFSGKPVYPFGAGIGYSQLQTRVVSAPPSLTSGEALQIEVEVENQGTLAAEEVLQLYVVPSAQQARERQELKAIKIAQVDAGDKNSVIMEIPAEDLVFIREDGGKSPYSGRVRFGLGADPLRSSDALQFSVVFPEP